MNPSESVTKSFLITGGAGFLGINLARYLVARGHQVTSYDLAPFEYDDVKHRVHTITADIRHAPAMNSAVRDIDVVVHCAAALPLCKPSDIYSTDVTGTRNALAAAHSQSVERFIHISSTAVYGIPDHHPLLESDELHGVGPYGEAKVEAERLCGEYRERGMCVSILRPKSFIGPERLGVFALLYEWAKEGRNFPVLGDGNNAFQYLDVEDLCDAIWLCATLPKERVNDTFNIGAREYGTFRSDFQAVLDYAGFGKRVVSLPAGPTIAVLRVLEKLRLSPLYQWVYESAGKESFVSIEKAQRQLGFSPRHSNRDALLRNFEWYRANGAGAHASGLTHRSPWKQGALRMARYFF